MFSLKKIITKIKRFFKKEEEFPIPVIKGTPKWLEKEVEVYVRIPKEDSKTAKSSEELIRELREEIRPKRFPRGSRTRQFPKRSRTQPASQTYTDGRRIRGMRSRSAYQKRQWRHQTSEEELEDN